MLFQLLSQYIEYKLYTSVEEVHEKIVVHHAIGDLTDGEFITLFDMLFPKVEEVIREDMPMLLNIIEEEVVVEEHPMPTKALDILHKMASANMLENEDHKLGIYKETGQLSVEQFNSFFVVEDIPTIIPEIVE